MKKPLDTLLLAGAAGETGPKNAPETVVQGAAKSEEWFCGATDVGRVRGNNEDRFLCDETRALFIVADGMGGHAAGEEASRIAIDRLSASLSPDILSATNLLEHMMEALHFANADVIRQSQGNYEWRGMGSTAVVAVLRDATLHIANVGDSRAYVVRGGAVNQVSRDHSMAAVLAEQRHIRPEEVRTHAMRNRLTMCLGIAEEIRPDTNRVPLHEEDFVLLCSDGLWDMLSDEEIGRLLQLYPSPKDAVNALVQAANEAGGKDNITVIVLYPQQTGDLSVNDASEDTVVVGH